MPGDMCAKSPSSFSPDLMAATQKSQWSGSIKRIRVHTRNTLSVLLSWYWWLAIAIVKRYDAFTALSGGDRQYVMHERRESESALLCVRSACDSDTASPLIESPRAYFSIRIYGTQKCKCALGERRRVAAQTKRHPQQHIQIITRALGGLAHPCFLRHRLFVSHPCKTRGCAQASFNRPSWVLNLSVTGVWLHQEKLIQAATPNISNAIMQAALQSVHWFVLNMIEYCHQKISIHRVIFMYCKLLFSCNFGTIHSYNEINMQWF